MKVLFFYRNAEWLGIEYLSSVLKAAGHHTELIFDPGIGDVEYKFNFLERFFDHTERMIELAKDYNPDLIAFSCLTNLYPWVSKMCRLIKQKMDVPIIVGGMHPTMLPGFVISNPDIDMICIGEGEGAILELVSSLEDKKNNYSIKNIWFKKDGKIIRNPTRPLIKDLNTLPFPDKDLFRRYGCFSDRLYVMTGRGCPYHCTYCFNSPYRKLLNTDGVPYVRRRSPSNVIDELEFFRNKYNIKEIFFYDDIFTIDEKWIAEFCQKYKKKIHLPFKILVHPHTVRKEMMRDLAEAGCIYVDMGIETGSEELRYRLLKRNESNQDIVNAAKVLKEVGIKFCTLNIVGFPTETKEQMWQTYRLNETIRPDGTIVSIFYPFPKTELADFCIENNFITEEEYGKICNGESGYKEGSIIRGIPSGEARRLQVLIPILTKIPHFLRPIFKRMPINNFTRVLSIFFLSIPRNTYIRIRESLLMFIKSQYFYLFYQKLY